MSTKPRIPRLDDQDQAEDLFLLAIDRRFLGTPTALLVCCDADARPLAHAHLVECDLAPTPSALSDVLQAVLDRLEFAGTPEVAGVSVGLTRPGGEQIQHYDKTWFRAVHRVCHRRGLVVHGVYVVSPVGARAIHIDDAA
jgi:hypothetical protein